MEYVDKNVIFSKKHAFFEKNKNLDYDGKIKIAKKSKNEGASLDFFGRVSR